MGGHAVSNDETHHEVDDAFSLIDREDRHDVRVVQAGGGLCLANEPCLDRPVEGEFRREDLDRDLAPEFEIGSTIYDRRPAAPDLAIDQVLRPDCNDDTVEQTILHDFMTWDAAADGRT